jgi:hypothetical protein
MALRTHHLKHGRAFTSANDFTRFEGATLICITPP